MNLLRELKTLSSGISILYVEDDVDLRESLSLYLRKLFEDVRVASNGKEALEMYMLRRPDIVISDILMPVMNGIEMLKQIKTIHPNQTMIITSAYSESHYFIEAINLSVGAYILKPIDYQQMNDVLYRTVRSIANEKELDTYHHHLESMIADKIEAYKSLESAREEDYQKILLALVTMIEQRDSYTAGHSQRVAIYAKHLAMFMGYDNAACEQLYQAGILHDIGKIATPDAILLKPERLNAIEYNLIKEHVNVGVRMLKDIPMFASLIDIIESHHERYDGMGYPHGIEKEAICPLARIMIVADAFDAMTTNRIYRHKKTVEEALYEIQSLSGKQFDPEVARFAQEAFKNIRIDPNISQLPTSALEEERFAYFYRDSISTLCNQKYLSIMLLKNSFNYEYPYAFVFSLHNFTAFNHFMGWDAGDTLLHDFATLLHTFYPHQLLFRIHANDFVLLNKTSFAENLALTTAIRALLKEDISYSIRCFELSTHHITSLQDFEHLMNPALVLSQGFKHGK